MRAMGTDSMQLLPPALDLVDELARCVAPERVLTRPLDRVAFASDASFYRLLPQAVVLASSVEEVQRLFAVSRERDIPLTFRAAGTSLSGQSLSDGLLVEVARILKGCVRDNDVTVRYGGDEYVVLLRGTDSGGALKVAERIRRTMETHQFLAREGYGLRVTTCIGVASFPEHATEQNTLLDFADRAMYRGKKSTRNVIYIASKGLEATPAARHSTPTA